MNDLAVCRASHSWLLASVLVLLCLVSVSDAGELSEMAETYVAGDIDDYDGEMYAYLLEYSTDFDSDDWGDLMRIVGFKIRRKARSDLDPGYTCPAVEILAKSVMESGLPEPEKDAILVDLFVEHIMAAIENLREDASADHRLAVQNLYLAVRLSGRPERSNARWRALRAALAEKTSSDKVYWDFWKVGNVIWRDNRFWYNHHIGRHINKDGSMGHSLEE